MILVLMRVLLIATDCRSRPEEFIDQAIRRLQQFRLHELLLPLEIKLRDFLLDLRQVLVGQRKRDAPALHLDDLLLDQGIFEEILIVQLVMVKLPHRDLVAVKWVVLGHLGHMHLQVEGALS